MCVPGIEELREFLYGVSVQEKMVREELPWVGSGNMRMVGVSFPIARGGRRRQWIV